MTAGAHKFALVGRPATLAGPMVGMTRTSVSPPLDPAPYAEIRAETREKPAQPTKSKDYAPGLDGIRGVAVAAITAYHLGYIDGGLLSVSVFFTLSGYLITSILLGGFRKSGNVDLKGFWLRRARRLFPALVLLLVVVLAATAIVRPAKLATYGKQAFSAAIYIANWATIARGDTYFNRFTGPAPLDHLWSLAIEEQFYAFWPLLVFGMLALHRRWGTSKTAVKSGAPIGMMVFTGLLAIASALTMARLFVPGGIDNTRAYEGTDGRIAPILVGCLTAMLMPLGEIGKGGRFRRIVLEIVGVISAALVVAVVLRTDEYSPFLYRGGESLVSVASAALIIAAGHPSTFIGKAFGFAPLQWFGARTYGVYLWHLPVIAFMPASMFEGRPVARGALQLGLIIALAALSWTLVEDPIRRDGVFATFSKGTGRTTLFRWASAILIVPIATFALATWSLLPHKSPSGRDVDVLMAELETDPPNEPESSPSVAPYAMTNATPSASVAPSGLPSANPAAPPASLFTSCTQLVHVGDSTSIGLMSAKYLPDADDRLDARYRSVGVVTFVPEISGGRSIVEKMKDHPSAYEVVSTKMSYGYKGCWVFAFGMNDAANIHGNADGLGQRIDWMMKLAAGSPVLWATGKTLLDKGPYDNGYLSSWNRAITLACERHPNMRIYDWASEVQDDWYLPDKIHPNDLGAKERAARFARALAVAFPKDRPSPTSCMVGSSPAPSPEAHP